MIRGGVAGGSPVVRIVFGEGGGGSAACPRGVTLSVNVVGEWGAGPEKGAGVLSSRPSAKEHARGNQPRSMMTRGATTATHQRHRDADGKPYRERRATLKKCSKIFKTAFARASVTIAVPHGAAIDGSCRAMSRCANRRRGAQSLCRSRGVGKVGGYGNGGAVSGVGAG